MTKFNPGDDVIVDFDGLDHQGEVVRDERGWVFCRIVIDINADYGSVGPRLDPHATVCVPESRVRLAD